jgi:SAM-dependent methyltransferase
MPRDNIPGNAEIADYNRRAWDQLVRQGNRWTRPVSGEIIEAARRGNWQIVLTPQRPVPREWLGDIRDRQVLCLAGAGGQQAPVLAAAGARVTVWDNSPAQLSQDQEVARREGLDLRCLQGDMRDLAVLDNDTFDVIVHPCSNGFVPDVNPVWQEAWRVLRPGGRLLAGFVNPVFYLFDYWEMQRGKLVVKYSIPYSDSEQLDPNTLAGLLERGEPLEFGHSLNDQIGGQLRAGFHVTGFYEDVWDDPPGDLLSRYIQPMIATLAEKPLQP